MSDEPKENNGFWLGLALGGLLGAVGSYLATTDEMERKKLLAKGKQMLRDIEDFGQSAYEKGEEVKESVTRQAKKIEKVIEEKAPVVQEAVEEKAGEIEQIAKKAIEEITTATHQAQKKGLKKFFFSKGRPLT